MEFSRQEYWSRLPFPSPGDLPDPGIEPGSPALQADSLPSEPPGNPPKVVANSLGPHRRYSPWNSPGQNTGVGTLSLLQGIFPTQGSNPGLTYYRQILYQLSQKGSPWASNTQIKQDNVLEYFAHTRLSCSDWFPLPLTCKPTLVLLSSCLPSAELRCCP